MPLASGADVRIGTREFMISTEADEPYLHFYENLFPTETDIVGAEGKKSANQNVLLWSYDNFIAGEGLRYYDKEQPSKYWYGNANPRIPGAIQSTPTRTISTTITTSVTPTEGFFTVVGGRIWYFTGEQGYYSTDGATWTENTDIAVDLPANYKITAACNDGEYAYYAASDGSNRGIWRVTTTTASVPFVTTHANTAEWMGMAVRDQYLYAWTGGALHRFDHTGGIPITYNGTQHRVYFPRVEKSGGTVYADMVAGEDALYYSRAQSGDTVIFEFKLDRTTGKFAGRQMWTLASGFTGRKICIQAGVLLVLGDYLDKVGLWGYSTINKQPLFLGYVGEAVNAKNVRYLAPSYGAQVTLGVDNGTTSYNYVYDLEEDAFSELDERTIAADGTLTAGATFRNRRVSAAFATTSTKINRWILDSDTPAGAWTWVSSAHDFEYPQDEKVLLGFHVVQDPSIVLGTIQVEYQLDENGTWINAGTGAAGASYKYWTISDGTTTRKTRTLRLRVTGASGARMFSITARAYVNSKQEIWKLALDMKNEPGKRRHPSDRKSNAVTLRNYLHTLVSDGNVVTFLDGRRRTRESDTNNTGYTTHTCLIEFPKDSADSSSEGKCEVILRSVAPSA